MISRANLVLFILAISQLPGCQEQSVRKQKKIVKIARKPKQETVNKSTARIPHYLSFGSCIYFIKLEFRCFLFANEFLEDIGVDLSDLSSLNHNAQKAVKFPKHNIGEKQESFDDENKIIESGAINHHTGKL